MDWYSWLLKTGLESSIVYEYGLAFSQNELEEDDISYFNHEFLQSMGISIAKHRLEILKLARTEQTQTQTQTRTRTQKHLIAKLLLVLKKTKKSLANYMATLVHRDNNGRALIVLSNKKKKKMMMIKGNHNNNGGISYSSRWKRSMMIRSNSKRFGMVNNNYYQDRLMLTNGDYLGDHYNNNINDNDEGEGEGEGEGENDSVVVSTPKLESYSSPLMYDNLHQNQNKEDKVAVDDHQEDHDEYWTPALEEIRWDAMFHDLKPT
ncbi:hypothetical protein SOVF_196720 [Spinacia oleracea]|nr:hypothetical protein SOVF_196720 [Spinacia oleracea]